MTAAAHRDELTTCPACWRTTPASDLCGCDDPDLGPYCPRCCARWHFGDGAA